MSPRVSVRLVFTGVLSFPRLSKKASGVLGALIIVRFLDFSVKVIRHTDGIISVENPNEADC